jgi:hypothetical protein
MSQYALRLPESLMKAARRLAKSENTSMNQLFVTAIAEKLSALSTEDYLARRAERADEQAYRNALAKVPGVPPVHDEDRLEPDAE